MRGLRCRRRLARGGRACLLVGAWILAFDARAYSTAALYRGDPRRTGGAGGRSFTGSPADGYTCGVCHRGEATAHELRGGPVGGYALGATYDFVIDWPGELAGLTVEATDLEGAPLGELVSPPLHLLEESELCLGGSPAAEVLELEDGRSPLGVSECGATRLRLQWTAPAEPVEGSIFLSMVIADGDGTPAGDSVAVQEVPLKPRDGATQCSISGDHEEGRGAWPSALLVLLGLSAACPRAGSRSRPWRRRAGLWLLLLVGVMAVGCARVQPYERGRLAQPDMQIVDEGDLDGGPEHALDYREGSAGGVGGNGGGCGCN